MIRTFTKEFLTDELDLPYNDSIIKSNEMIDTSRWSIQYRLVFEYEDKFWSCGYQVGATESQDESPWEYDDEVECTEVESVEVTVKQWKAVK